MMQSIDDALAFGRKQLDNSPTPHIDARLLLTHLLGVDHAYLIAHSDQILTPAQCQTYAQQVQRAAAGEPVAYIIGRMPFRHITLHVTPDVLIPRAETELLVAQALHFAAGREQPHIVDVGTGSGCIAVSLACELPHATITAIDVSAAALAVARRNADENRVENVQFIHGSLLEPMPDLADVIVANLPYITSSEWTQLDRRVKLYEPELALHGGADGLQLIRALLAQAPQKLRRDGVILLEIGWRQREATTKLARQNFPEAKITCLRDYAGLDRIIVIECGGNGNAILAHTNHYHEDHSP
ncbi:MAG: peptide chain release factor N(5)-glutamine methyltransferase [Anaerolineae bacterium]|nr:peptide chain release factor N(5)-glutamine methyltransferase [Anaerolineae bacterium]